MTDITSLELNYLIFRYLHESGLIHSAFALGCEAGLNTITVDGNPAPPGALASFIQKGLQYLEMEANMNADGTDPGGDFIKLTPLELMTKNVDELRQLVKERRNEKLQLEKPGTALMVETRSQTAAAHEPSIMRDKQAAKSGKEKEMRDKEKTKASKSTKAASSGTKRRRV